MRITVLVALVLGAVAFLLLSAPPAHAQVVSDETLLLRSCVSERGWRIDTDDCAAIAEVVRYRAERLGVSFAAALRALAPRLHSGRITRRRWLLDLDVDCHRPAGLDATWETPMAGTTLSRREACEATVAEVREILTGARSFICAERPHAWGSHADVARREASGFRWVNIDCPEATFVNLFGRLYERSRR